MVIPLSNYYNRWKFSEERNLLNLNFNDESQIST